MTEHTEQVRLTDSERRLIEDVNYAEESRYLGPEHAVFAAVERIITDRIAEARTRGFLEAERTYAKPLMEMQASAWDEGWNASSITTYRRALPDAWDYDPIKNPYRTDCSG